MTGKCPASLALEGGVKGHNMKKIPYREAMPFRAWSFTPLSGHRCYLLIGFF
jgi:hypothetical protein